MNGIPEKELKRRRKECNKYFTPGKLYKTEGRIHLFKKEAVATDLPAGIVTLEKDEIILCVKNTALKSDTNITQNDNNESCVEFIYKDKCIYFINDFINGAWEMCEVLSVIE